MADSKKELEELPLPALPRGGARMYTTWPEMIKHWPKTTFCIVANEFCERFSYYGMRTVLTFYILNVLKFDANTTTIFFNSFTILCYLTPLLGSIIADGYIGKFWTIFSVSIIYAIGQIVLAVASVQKSQSGVHPWMDLLGLLIIGFGTGGIKPCVSAFGADQFDKGQERMLSVYFSMFYFSINAGSMISTFISPIFRAQPCLGQDSCYPLAFGIPAVLMIVATCLFMAGSFWYKKPPPTENVFGEVTRIIAGAISNKFSSRNTGPTEHWLDHYLDTHDCDRDPRCIALQHSKRKNKCQKAGYVSDIKALLHLIVMFLPVPMFWALYDQQGSVWLIQGIQMNCDVFGILLLPDQMQTLNAVLILLFIPLFQVVIYPILSKCFELTPLRKMVGGGWLAALAFLITGLVQLQVNATLPQLPDKSHSFVSFMNVWDSDCDFTVTPTNATGDMGTLKPTFLAANTSMVDIKGSKYTFHVNKGSSEFHIDYAGTCTGSSLTSLKYNFEGGKVYYVAIGPLGAISSEVATAKPTQGTGEFSLGIALMTEQPYSYNLAMCRETTSGDQGKNPCNPQKLDDFAYWETDYDGHTDDRKDNITIRGDSQGRVALQYAFKDVKPGKYRMYYLNNRPRDYDQRTYSSDQTSVTDMGLGTIEINGQGGVYSLVITGPGNVKVEGIPTKPHSLHVYTVVQDNKVSILWQVPQIVVITAAEILFSITGYEFAYSQASSSRFCSSAPSMKAVVQALWLLTTAAGDTIIVIITALDLFDDMAVEFFVYAGAMFLVICLFALMSIFYYEYHYFTKADHEDEEDSISEESSDDYINKGYQKEKEEAAREDDDGWGADEGSDSMKF